MEEFKSNQEKEVTWENTIFIGNKINFTDGYGQSGKYEILDIKHFGEGMQNGGYFQIKLRCVDSGKEDFVQNLNIGA